MKKGKRKENEDKSDYGEKKNDNGDFNNKMQRRKN